MANIYEAFAYDLMLFTLNFVFVVLAFKVGRKYRALRDSKKVDNSTKSEGDKPQ